MAAKTERRVHSDAFKKRAVERILAGRISVPAFAEEKDIADSVVYAWCRDPRYGGKPDAKRTRAKPNGAAHGGLPTKAAPKGERPTRPKRAIPLTWACPHCGGPILIGEE